MHNTSAENSDYKLTSDKLQNLISWASARASSLQKMLKSPNIALEISELDSALYNIWPQVQ